MSLTRLVVRNFRSIRSLEMDLSQTTVIVGPNGSGKTNIYRALVLVSAAAAGRLARALLVEGGLSSALWAGHRLERKGEPVRMGFEATVDVAGQALVYTLEVGLPTPGRTAFYLDPDVKAETVSVEHGGRQFLLAERKHGLARVRDDQDRWVTYEMEIDPSESILSQLRDPQRFPVLDRIRADLASWRSYHGFRTDDAAEVRRPQPGVRTTVLAPDGSDLAAVLQTVRENGGFDLDGAVETAFPGHELRVVEDRGTFEVTILDARMERPFRAREISDGTIKYLCLVAVLGSPSPPVLMVLNEPEASLHPRLLVPLAGLVAAGAARCQVVVCTHAAALADAVADLTPTTRVAIERGAVGTVVTAPARRRRK